MTVTTAPSTDHRRGTWWFISAVLLLLTPVGWLAWSPGEPGGGQWALFALGLPALAGWVLWRTRRGGLHTDVDGALHARRILGRSSVDLQRLAAVALAPTLPYADQLGAELKPARGFGLRDERGGELWLETRGYWQDVQPVLALVVAQVRDGPARCDPRTWDQLVEDAGLRGEAFPQHLTQPPQEAWGTTLRVARRQRLSSLVPLFALTGIPLAPAVMGVLAFGTDEPLRALTALAGGLVGTGLPWAGLWWVVRRGDREQVRVGRDGTLAAVHRRTTMLRLGLALEEGRVELASLVRCELVPGSRTHASKRDTPAWWVLELEDAAGGSARVSLLHPWDPPATLLPLLVHHLEAGGVELDRHTHRGLSLRLGRSVSLPARG